MGAQVTTPGAATPIPAGITRMPLQQMTPEQLRDGLRVTVRDDASGRLKGSTARTGSRDAGAGDTTMLAVARLVQDAADYMAQTAGVGASLKSVTLNDRKANEIAAAGFARFTGPDAGEFHLSPLTTRDVIAGIEHLRREPIAAWSTTDATAFASANQVLLHESDHITLPSYDRATIDDYYRDPRRRPTEEALTEIASAGRLGDFFRARYGQDLPPATTDLLGTTGVYTRYVQRMRSLLDLAGVHDERQVVDTAQRLGDATVPSQRFRALATAVAGAAGGAAAPPELVSRLEEQIPRWMDERPATGVRTIVAALADLRNGRSVDMDALRTRLDELKRIGDGADRRDGWPR